MTGRLITLLATLAPLAAFAMPAHADVAKHTVKSSKQSVESSNWAGYAVSKPGVRFRNVSGSWVQPAASCSAGPRKYSAYWLGLGGFHSTSSALEQIGTQVDCSSLGEAVYSAWYELVPAAPVHIALAVRPGDTLSSSVTVTGRTVKLALANQTTGASFTKQLRPKRVDLTSAEWVVEAPSTCDAGGCDPLPLANFGSASFASATATTTRGHRGAIADPAWARTAISLSAHANGDIGTDLTLPGSSAEAAPGDLAASGDGFTVTYQDVPPAPPVPPPAPPVPPPAPAAPLPIG
jgi:Peptidase A4 family